MYNLKKCKIKLFVTLLLLFLPAFTGASEQCKIISSTIPESYKPLPPLYFIEEWDNGLTGNNPWVHQADGQEPDNGMADSVVAFDVLLKYNSRYANIGSPLYNDSTITFTDYSLDRSGI